MQFKDDLYQILNIPEYASQNVIKQAYHILAKKYHPDVSNHNGQMFAEITDAYKILSNPTLKAQYDEYLKQKHIKEDLEKTNKEQAEEFLKQTQEHLNRTQNNFSKQAAQTLNETDDTIFDEPTHSSKYYVNPSKEPIFTVIKHFSNYRFENAISAIWNRSILVLLGAAIVYTILTPLNIFFKLCNISTNKHNYKYHWVKTINHTLNKPKIIKPIFWTIFLYILTLSKLISNICHTIYWTFKHIIVPFLLPNAIRSLKR